MFDLGFFELLVIAVVALVVLGPERLPKAARMGGLWVRKARAQWYSVKSEFERELAADELKRSLAEPAAQLRDEVAQAGRDVRGAVGDVDRGLRDAAPAAAAPGTSLAELPLAPDETAATASDATPADATAADAVPESGPAQANLFDAGPDDTPR